MRLLTILLNCRLLNPQYYLYPFLGNKFPFDEITGSNGRVWIKAENPKHTIATARCIEKADPDGDNLDATAVKKFLGTLDV